MHNNLTQQAETWISTLAIMAAIPPSPVCDCDMDPVTKQYFAGARHWPVARGPRCARARMTTILQLQCREHCRRGSWWS
jgi:hypothetical protein